MYCSSRQNRGKEKKEVLCSEAVRGGEACSLQDQKMQHCRNEKEAS